ncbi:MAG: DUF5722 domain-containing protein [Lachnospiraceae bacterium]|nr:DUF5722 domain-containing protein [Lachnospiraceae bacterium]
MNLETGKRRKPARRKRARKPIRKSAGLKARRKNRTLGRVIAVLVLILTLGTAGAGIYLLLKSEPEPVSPEVDLAEILEEVEPEEEQDDTDIGKGILEHIFTAGDAVRDSYEKRPKSYEVSEINASGLANVSECVINSDTGRVSVKVTGEGIPKSDDKYYYLFALNTYDNGITAGMEYLDREYKDSETLLSAGLGYNSAGSRLYKKFVAAVKVDGEFVQVGTPRYITNPEAVAKYSSVFQQPASIKGILVDPNKLRGNELDDLGVKQAAYNIPVARLLGPTSSAAYPTIYYTYNGKTYTLNGQVVAEYDLVFSTLTAKGITTTAILLNNRSSAYPQLIHPQARSGGSAPYYMFNGAEESGVEYMAAIGSFLAERYSGSSHGRISNWVIANEINARKEWNYMAHTDIESYVEEYVKAFRVFYTAIKSVSGSARVYISLDQQWDRNIKNNTNYDARDVLDAFNNNISAKGNIDWGVAQHPYNVPLTEARTWKSSKYVKHDAGTSMLTMANIEVLINYMRQEHFRNDDGEVRSILISELGYTSKAGEANQAAAFAYAYYKMEAYEEIDGFLLNRETDAAEEVAQGLSFGLSGAGGNHKQIYNVFKYIDTPQHAEYTNFAKDIIGISNWSEIIR